VTYGKESDRIPEIAGAGGCYVEFLARRSVPRLVRRGLNIMEFCKAFNAQTQKEEKNTPIPVVITIYADSFVHLRNEDPSDVVLPQAGRQKSSPVRKLRAATRPAR